MKANNIWHELRGDIFEKCFGNKIDQTWSNYILDLPLDSCLHQGMTNDVGTRNGSE